MTRTARRIEDHALIGNGRTAALVARDGTIDWLCLPRFDSAAVFAALLGDEDNGCWRIAPAASGASVSRRYLPGTLVLETRWQTASGVVTVVDFMFADAEEHALFRIVRGEEGSVELDTTLVLRFDYGRTVPWVTREDERTLVALAGPERVVVRADVALRSEDMRTHATFRVEAGESVAFELARSSSWRERPPAHDPEARLRETEAHWRDFTERCPDVGRWQADVERSLITLKGLIHAPTGGIVAAPTTSLPERIGGSRNWDYRYCWLRDASLTLMALMALGVRDEMEAWCEWLVRAVAGAPSQLQIMYGVAGERRLSEWTADWLDGYEGSTPVRIGNAAAGQFQLDVYGELVEALALIAEEGPEATRGRAADLVATIVRTLESRWEEPDDGIWEIRGERRQFVHSKVMAWVAFDRASRLRAVPEEERGRWRAIAERIHDQVCESGYDETLGSFVQDYGSKNVDASLLQIAITGFLPPDNPRVIGTVRSVEERLLHDGFVARYDTRSADDGTAGGDEGAFLLCTFWLVDAYVLVGRREEAEALFERCVALCNDVGLLSEEYDPVEKRMLGNFPQAFSHVGLIGSALNLRDAGGPAHERAARSGRDVPG